MINPIEGTEQKDLDDMIRVIDGKTACKICGAVEKNLYSTNRGYVCKTHARAK